MAFERRQSKTHAIDIVQFACPMYYVDEAEGFVQLEVMRLGALEGEVKVCWSTEDVSGKAGDRYVANSGVIVFRPNEAIQSIRVDILVLPEWCPTLEFKVILTDPENCYLGLYLQTCNIKVIDDDTFPSNKYAAEIKADKEGVRNVNSAGLFIEFSKMVFHQRGLHWKTITQLIFDQTQNVYLYLKLVMSAYLVNVVLNPKGDFDAMIIPNNREGTAAVIGMMYIVPFTFLHLWDYTKLKMDMQGSTHVFLSTCLFRKYLNYSEASRQYVFPAEMQLGLLNETRDLAVGYVLLLDLCQLVGKLFILLFFVLMKEPAAFWIIALMPVLMIGFGFARGSQVANFRRAKDNRERELIGIIAQTCDKYLTIRHYFCRSAREEMFRLKADETRRAEVPVNIAMNNNLYAAKWLGPVFTGIYICLNAPHVISGDLQLGFFLATISILGNMSDLFVEFYSGYQRLSEMSEPLNTLSIYYNLPTDLREFKKATEDELKWMHQARKDVMSRPAPDGDLKLMRTDTIPIILDGLSFKYGRDVILSGCNLEVPQGSTVAITGKHGSGKATVLKLLGRTMTCHAGNVLIPPHLRVLFVSQEPCILRDLTLWQNLTMGCPNGVDMGLMHAVLQDMDMQRVMDALDHFKDGPRIVSARQDSLDEEHSARDMLLDKKQESAALQQDNNTKKNMAQWFEKLNYSEQAKIHLARAFIMNPEVMVMHRPVSHFDEARGREILQLIRHHTKNRGLCMPLATLGRRRPRTVIMSTDTEWQESTADHVWRLDHKTGSLTELQAPQINPDVSGRHDILTKHRTKSHPSQPNGSAPRLPERHCSDSWMGDLCFQPGRREDGGQNMLSAGRESNGSYSVR